ncbi:hypothetical protein [Buttiauxella sp. B2]|uniref:hypothetical protein n=1 Tax=Buttiauxella sp. B2 TaxID=2587812 RepID=UPI001674ABA8|nr:hypothetical protein [Buttiauxella sp. B2]
MMPEEPEIRRAARLKKRCSHHGLLLVSVLAVLTIKKRAFERVFVSSIELISSNQI